MAQFEIDKKIIEEIIYCQHSFACLDGDFSCCGGVDCGDDDFLCNNSFDKFCYYRIPYLQTKHYCGCYVRREIFKKYGL